MRQSRINIEILFLLSLAMIMWLLTIATTSLTSLTPEDLGILNKMPIYFWISLLFCIVAFKRIFDSQNFRFFFAWVIIFTLVLIGTYSFVEANARHQVSYYPSAIANQILEEGGLPREFPGQIVGNPYFYYSGFPILTAVVMEVTGIDLGFIIHYFPVFFQVISALLFVSLSRMLLNEVKLVFLASSFFVVLNHPIMYFWPPIMGHFLLLVFLNFYFIFEKYQRENCDTGLKKRMSLILAIVVITLFVALNQTHLLVSFSIVTFLIILTLLLRLVIREKMSRFGLPLLLLVIFFLWIVHVAGVFFGLALIDIIKSFQSFENLGQALTLGQAPWQGVPTRSISFTCSILFSLFNFGVPLLFLASIFRRRKISRLHIILISWLLAVSSMIFTVYGGEIVARVHALSLIGTAPLIALFFKEKPKLAFAAFCCLTLMFPIVATGQESFRMVTNSELRSAAFFTSFTAKTASVFYENDRLLWYFDPYRRPLPELFYSLWYPPVSDFDLNEPYQFLIYSESTHNGYTYYLNYDPINNVIGNVTRKFNQIYENDYCTIYSRNIP